MLDIERLESICAEVADREGCTLYDVEFSGNGRNRIVRVFIDKNLSAPAEGEENPEGVGIEDCTNVSRALNLRLDVEDLIPGGAYHLEVSSPGLERHLRKPEHFSSVIGQEIVLRTSKAFAEYGLNHRSKRRSKQARMMLRAIEDDSLQVVFVDEELTIPRADIVKAHLHFDFDQKGQKSGGKKGKSRG